MFFLQANNANFSHMTRDESTIQFIVVHYTGNNGDTARNNLEYFHREQVKASSNFFVDEKEVCCSVPVYNVAWHCGGSKYPGSGGSLYGKVNNYNSIGIELCSLIDGNGRYYIPEQTQKNAAEYIRFLMKEYHIPIERVVRHYDVTGKFCPRPFVFPEAWEGFKSLLVEKVVDTVDYYEKLEHIPAGEMRNTVEKLVKAKIVKGNAGGLHLTKDMVRLLVFNDRAGLYQNI